MSVTFTVPATATYQNTETGKRRRYYEGDVVDIVTAVAFAMPGAELPEADAPFTDEQVAYLEEQESEDSPTDHEHAPETQSVTATVTGATTGTIADPASGRVFVPVTSDSAAKKILLPDATPGTNISLRNGATGYVLDGGDSTVNGFSSIAVPANTLVECRRDTSGTWVARRWNVGGSILGQNLFENGSFEVGAVNWTAWSEAEGEALEIVSVGVISGGGSLQVTTPGDENQEGIAYNAFFLVDPGQSYRLAFTIKGDLTVRIQLRPGFVPSEKVTWDRVLTSTPETVVFDFLAAATVGNARFEVFTNSGAPQDGVFVLDDLSFREILA